MSVTTGTWLDTLDVDRYETLVNAVTFVSTYDDILDYAGGDESFALWLTLVDVRIDQTLGVRYSDLPDWSWRDAYEAGSSPRGAMNDALADMGLGL